MTSPGPQPVFRAPQPPRRLAVSAKSFWTIGPDSGALSFSSCCFLFSEVEQTGDSVIRDSGFEDARPTGPDARQCALPPRPRLPERRRPRASLLGARLTSGSCSGSSRHRTRPGSASPRFPPKTDSIHPHHPEGVVYGSFFCLNSGTVAVSKVPSRRWWCIESLFPCPRLAPHCTRVAKRRGLRLDSLNSYDVVLPALQPSFPRRRPKAFLEEQGRDILRESEAGARRASRFEVEIGKGSGIRDPRSEILRVAIVRTDRSTCPLPWPRWVCGWARFSVKSLPVRTLQGLSFSFRFWVINFTPSEKDLDKVPSQELTGLTRETGRSVPLRPVPEANWRISRGSASSVFFSILAWISPQRKEFSGSQTRYSQSRGLS